MPLRPQATAQSPAGSEGLAAVVEVAEGRSRQLVPVDEQKDGRGVEEEVEVVAVVVALVVVVSPTAEPPGHA